MKLARSHLRWACFAAAAGCWAAALAFAGSRLFSFEQTPGRAGPTPTAWPGGRDMRLSASRVTLVMALHPRCTCSQASLAELEKLRTRFPDRFIAYVLITTPQSAPAGWEESKFRPIAEKIPGAIVMTDLGGKIAKRFGARTSGHVCAYDAAGKLLFSGGITASRGHEGPSLGGESLARILSNQSVVDRRAPVFGCPINDPEEASRLTTRPTASCEAKR